MVGNDGRERGFLNNADGGMITKIAVLVLVVLMVLVVVVVLVVVAAVLVLVVVLVPQCCKDSTLYES